MKRTPLKRRRTTSIARLKRECDALWAKVVKAQAGWRCVRCDSPDNLHGHHIVKRSRSAYLRHNIDNGLCLCRDCHVWWHNASEIEAVEWTRTVVPSGTIEHLMIELQRGRGGWRPSSTHYRDTKVSLEHWLAMGGCDARA